MVWICVRAGAAPAHMEAEVHERRQAVNKYTEGSSGEGY